MGFLMKKIAILVFCVQLIGAMEATKEITENTKSKTSSSEDIISKEICQKIMSSPTIKMPSGDILSQRLKSVGMVSMMEHTNIINELADHNLTPLEVAVAVECAIESLVNYYNTRKTMLTRALRMNKSLIIGVLLQDYPQGLELLKELNIMHPAEK